MSENRSVLAEEMTFTTANCPIGPKQIFKAPHAQQYRFRNRQRAKP